MIDLAGLRGELDRLLAELPATDLPNLVAELEAAKGKAWLRLAMPSPAAPEQGLVDAAELARRLNVAETWVRDAARRGRIPCIYAGVHVRFDVADVVAAMKAGDAALPDRSALSARGRRAAEHRIVTPARRKRRSNGADFSAPATTLLPHDDAEHPAGDAADGAKA